MHLPTLDEVETIASENDPVLRNLQITQCYHELSAAFLERTGPLANWCTFATWASRQAGQTIRKEDLKRTLEAELSARLRNDSTLVLLTSLLKEMGTHIKTEELEHLLWKKIITQSIERSSEAVARGNQKVFEEIGYEFARFEGTCLNDLIYKPESIETFCQKLRIGLPPEGQQYLQQAFTHYYESFFETDFQKKAELQLLANLEIGFHEQTRLQPEIQASLESVLLLDTEGVKQRIQEILFPAGSLTSYFRMLVQKMLGRKAAVEQTLDDVMQRVVGEIRLLITSHLLTLMVPPNVRLRLGQDLTSLFPENLRSLSNERLRILLAQIDPTLDSVRESGALDWANLPERLHFIADFFRCYQESVELLEAPFTALEVQTLKQGRVPQGRL
ncbi:hypothetical protein [Siphonobacter curvatus]|uniref:Uncharacterized protein n=1 Tax=Siphonobacter curvatus TaxID=2094562 RepID=A0A2S7ISM6_9BACT|nr:hypothetical protein [Siphonobacter curvatus]PQA60590.1 hypothetical protein C5O19_13525 [Siphonobacter curvatus]